jgi:hypothetical protein
MPEDATALGGHDVEVHIADSGSLPLADAAVSLVVTSPPYCTRIDYAVATRPELAVLGCGFGSSFAALRTSLIGSTLTKRTLAPGTPSWGSTSLALLDQVRTHSSKASSAYYLRYYSAYLSAMARSLRELGRVVARGGHAVLVAQSSFYREHPIPLPTILAEMAEAEGLALLHRLDYPNRVTLADINPARFKYRESNPTYETVLVFRKSAA